MSSWVGTLNETSSIAASAVPSVVAGSHAEAVWSDALLVRAHLSHEDLSGLLKSFTITTVSEIGDKTFLTSAILAMRHPPVTVFWGSWTAMICMSTLSSLMGAVLPAILSRHGALWISAALFLGFGVVMLYHGWNMQDEGLGEEWKEAQNEICADEEQHELDDMERGEPSIGVYPNVTPYPSVSGGASTLTRASQVLHATPKTSTSVFLKEGTRNLCGLFFSAVFSQAFLLNFLGEWGDRSQITTMALAATHRVAIVAVGTSLAHMSPPAQFWQLG
ncbi:GCR1-dependent translation factor 1 [Malassezia yamatoensis]|uniref:GDT1 family protein n=1 Tax=Malassezia yamatoensis TaxID=253288 RepID=A0AAJ5Z0Y0_9BASI|nr:GCR1-dependent translation factor 1 [Malassezia yamatoensis]